MKVIKHFGNPAALAILNCWLETGRTHQIRAHLAYIGHGLIGDPVYGRAWKISKTSMEESSIEAVAFFPRQALHASVLGFIHPRSGQNLRFEVKPPDDMSALLDVLDTTYF